MSAVTFRYIHVARLPDGTKVVSLRWPLEKGLPGIPLDELDALCEVAMELAERKDEIRDLVVASIQQTGWTRGWHLSTRTTPLRWKPGAEAVLQREFGDIAFERTPKPPTTLAKELGPNAAPLIRELSTGGETTTYLRRPESTFVRARQ